MVTNELVRDVSAAGQSFFNRELMGAISDAVDAAFLDMIVVDTGTTSNVSSGVTAVDAKTDLRTALLGVNTVGTARLFWIASVDVAKVNLDAGERSTAPTHSRRCPRPARWRTCRRSSHRECRPGIHIWSTPAASPRMAGR